ncbi:MAG: FxSxx-COOH system tetratricopeptide repeat protein [Chloroflexi bacterium]|nr:FxSxx-COOH system tetratricopeptide repeat protein [Chloroflexota bacterium]MCI0575766.1 FxSxx-COOH system tetratricopeptide repeat protein [Chloroflexota bacterium]MCI0643627.1 FxSxx-COOH system tetratricopeptide repeat protein [Chloroflexota bacterium]MCI0729832.1 FxSxx-COOH system tetratricopeptide repeat protein [Chloroflexota bacterium]
MKAEYDLADVLDEYMRSAGYGTLRLANHVNQLVDRPHFLHRGTITNWLTGRACKVRDWRQLTAVAAVLGLNEAQANKLLQAAGLPTVRALWETVDESDQIFLGRIPLSPTAGWLDWNQNSLPPPQPLPPGSRLPLRANPLFVGREEKLRRLAWELQERVSAVGPTIVLSGLGGIGKTQLAVEFAYRYGRFFSGGVFWFNFGRPETVPAQVAATGSDDALNLRPDFDELPVEKQVGLVQRAWQEEAPRLLIFDGCEEEPLLTQWQPTSGGCRVLVTSRRGCWDPTLGVTALAVDVLARTESIALLQRFRSDLTHDEADRIAVELGDLPLALHLAGSFLAYYRYEVCPAAYLAQLQALRGPALLDHPSLQGQGTAVKPTGHELHVARTFVLSYERLQPDRNESDALAQVLLSRAACFAPGEPIPRQLLLATLVSNTKSAFMGDNLQVSEALTRLVALGLVIEGAAGAIRLHQLLAHFVSGAAGEPDAQADVEQTVIAEAQRLNKMGNSAGLRGWQVHLQYLTAVAQSRNDQRAAQLANELGTHLSQEADFVAARRYLEQALAIQEKIFGPQHPQTAQSLNNLGVLLQLMGAYEAARPCFERALTIREKTLGAKHPETAESLNDLGWLLSTTGDYEAARCYYERALAIREEVIGAAHPETAHSLNDLGVLSSKTGRYELARRYHERAQAIREEMLGEVHLDTAESLNNLGATLVLMGAYQTARPYYERALAIRRKLLGENHPQIAHSLGGLGVLLYRMGAYEAARPYYEQALTIFERTVGMAHFDTGRSLNNLGHLFQTMGDYEEAQRYYERALASFEMALGHQHPLVAGPCNNLGLLFTDMRRCDEAYAYLERAFVIRLQALGPEHPDTAQSLKDLDHLLEMMGKPLEEGIYLEQACVIQEEKAGAS